MRALSLLLLVQLAVLTMSSPAHAVIKPLKLIVHVNFADGERQGHGIKNIQNILEASKADNSIEVVVHGAGINLLVTKKSSQAKAIEDLVKKGVKFAACENTMREKKISKEELLPGVVTVPSGALEVATKQSEGFAYFKP